MKTGSKNKFLGRTLLAGVSCLGMPAALTVSAFLAPVAIAQDYTSGALTAQVVDQTGKAISGANVTIRSVGQGFTRNATSDATGQIRLPALPQGSYAVAITASGYDPLPADSTVNVSASSTSNFTFTLNQTGAARDVVVGRAVQENLDFTGTTQGIVVNVQELAETLPIARNLTAVTLLSPSAVAGDSTFGNFAAIGGGSVAENAYYINGLNITNFDNYIGASIVPFEFYQSVEVKTSAYPAEYGRATGGILNAVTKSGTNEFKGALHLNWTPDGLREQSPDTYAQRNQLDVADEFSAILEYGGPIIKDRLFFYALAEYRANEFEDAGLLSGRNIRDISSDPFYGLKLDGYITDDHRLEFTYLDTTRDTIRKSYPFDVETDEIGSDFNKTVFENGGESWVAKYTGSFTDWLTISAAYGNNKDKQLTLPGSTEARVIDSRTGIGGADRTSQTTTTITNPRNTEREMFRIDADLYFDLAGSHHVRTGYEIEKLDFARSSIRTGPDGVIYIYRTASATDRRALGAGAVPVGSEYVEVNYFNSGGSFYAENEAAYVQDEWEVNDQLTLNLGVRLDRFANFTADGSQFIDFDNEIGPRVGFIYDLEGNGRSKFYGNFGTYYLPVAGNTAFRQGSQEFFFREYWRFSNSPLANATPTLTTQILNYQGARACPFGLFGADGAVGCDVTGSGEVQDPTASISRNLEATQEDEFVFGYQRRIGDLWSVNAAFIYRDLVKTAEDVAVDLAVIDFCQKEGIEGCDEIWTGFHQYTIINPGSNSTITLNEPLPGETTQRTIDFTAQQLGYPQAERTYSAVELSFERDFDGVWGVRGSYTLSESRGNSEGYVKSDVGQTDAGITQDFDTPNLTDGSDGLLPNHRAHAFKVFGQYQVTENLLVGANASLISPRKFGCFGVHPDLYDPDNGQFDPADLYGAASFFCGGVSTPRGTVFESDWNKNIDVSFRYTLPFLNNGVVLRADIFNLFNFESALDFDEFGEEDNGDVNEFFRQPLNYQAPRAVRIGVDIKF